MSQKPLFSTDSNVATKPKKDKKKPDPNSKLSAGPIKYRIEKKGRGGKTITIIYDLPYSIKEAKSLLKELKSKFAVGGTFKNQNIELNGRLEERLREYFASKES